MSDKIIPITMPKWGLSMKVGTLTDWYIDEGQTIMLGQQIMDIETDKITAAVEAADGGLLRRKVGQEGEVYPVKGLLGVLAPMDVSDEEIDAFIAEYDALPEVGHGCGHNLIAAGAVGAALGAQSVLDDLGGVVLVMGTPAEEFTNELQGKIQLLNAGEFAGIDACLMFHPWIVSAPINSMSSGIKVFCIHIATGSARR